MMRKTSESKSCCTRRCCYYTLHWIFIVYTLFLIVFISDWKWNSSSTGRRNDNDYNPLKYSRLLSGCVNEVNDTAMLHEDANEYFAHLNTSNKGKNKLCFIEGTKFNVSRQSCVCQSGWSGPSCSVPRIVRISDYPTNEYPLSIRGIPRRIINAFPFNDEFDLLDVRLMEIGDVVDVFLVLESNYTSRGDPKPLNLRNKLNSAGNDSQYSCKIVHVFLDFFPFSESSTNWKAVERLLRNHLSDYGLRHRLLGYKNDDIFVLTDADEIPRRETLLFLKLHNGYPEPVGFHFQASIYGFFWRARKETHVFSAVSVGALAAIFKYKSMLYRSVDIPVMMPDDPETLLASLSTNTADISPWSFGDVFEPAGWHCSWCATPTGIAQKLRSAVNGDYPRWGDYSEKLNETYIEKLIKEGLWFDNKRKFLPADYSKPFYAPTVLLRLKKTTRFAYLLKNPYAHTNITR